MDTEEIIDAIKTIRRLRMETALIEAKTAKGGFPDCLDTLSSFANKHGGLIIFGLSEDRRFAAEGVYDVQQLQNKLTGVGKNCMTPALHIDILPFEFEGKTLVAARVPELPQHKKPCYITKEGVARGSYTRVGESDERMTEYELYALQSYSDSIQEDRRPIRPANIEELDEVELMRYMAKIKAEKPNFAKSSKEKFFELSGITSGGTPTLAGTLVFGVYPQAYCPQLFVACSVIPGVKLGDVGDAGQRFDDNQRIEGTIEQMLMGTMGFLRRNMKKRVVIDDKGKRVDIPEYPLKALREAVANALVHRDYSRYTERAYIQVYMYDDRIEIINPGELYGANRIEKLGTATMMETRNSNIVRLLEEKDSFSTEAERPLENRHTGIPTMREEMAKYGLPEPEFREERDTFRVIFRRGSDIVSDIVNRGGDDQSDIVSDTVGDIVVKRSDVVDIILGFCDTPRSAAEIAERLGMTSRPYVVNKYLRPLVNGGRLFMTKPEKPTARDQKYYSR